MHSVVLAFDDEHDAAKFWRAFPNCSPELLKGAKAAYFRGAVGSVGTRRDDINKAATDLASWTKSLESSAKSADSLYQRVHDLADIVHVNVAPLKNLLEIQENLEKSQVTRQERISEIGASIVAKLSKQKQHEEEVARTRRILNDRNRVFSEDDLAKLNDRLLAHESEVETINDVTHALHLQAAELASVDKTGKALAKSVVTGALELAAFNAARRTVSDASSFNKTVIAANSSLSERVRLLNQALDVQIRTGSSLQDLAEETEALRQNALIYFESTDSGLTSLAAAATKFGGGITDPRNNASLDTLLTTVDMLHKSLGISIADAARLAGEAKSLGTALTHVADVMATVQDRTSLTGANIVGLGDTLHEVLRGIGRDGTFDIAIRQASALEESLKKVGATAGTAADIIKSFSDIGAKGGLAMAFGAGPGMGLGESTDEMNKFIKRVSSQLEGPLEAMRKNPGSWGAVVQFKAMADMFGLSTRRATELVGASKLLEQKQKDLANNTKTIAQRFIEQSSNTNAVWSQLFNNLKALMELGLRPLTRLIYWLNKELIELREYLSTLPEGVKTILKIAAEFAAATATAGIFVRLLRSLGPTLLTLGSRLKTIFNIGTTGNIVKTVGDSVTGVGAGAVTKKVVAGAGTVIGTSATERASSRLLDWLNTTHPKVQVPMLAGKPVTKGVADLARSVGAEVAMKSFPLRYRVPVEGLFDQVKRVGNLPMKVKLTGTSGLAEVFKGVFGSGGVFANMLSRAGSFLVSSLSRVIMLLGGPIGALAVAVGAPAVWLMHRAADKGVKELQTMFDNKNSQVKRIQDMVDQNAAILTDNSKTVAMQVDELKKNIIDQTKTVVENAGKTLKDKNFMEAEQIRAGFDKDLTMLAEKIYLQRSRISDEKRFGADIKTIEKDEHDLMLLQKTLEAIRVIMQRGYEDSIRNTGNDEKKEQARVTQASKDRVINALSNVRHATSFASLYVGTR